MGRFFGLWVFGTVGFILAFYFIMFGFAGAFSFISWNIQPVKGLLLNLDWAVFRVTLCLSILIGFAFAFAESDH